MELLPGRVENPARVEDYECIYVQIYTTAYFFKKKSMLEA